MQLVKLPETSYPHTRAVALTDLERFWLLKFLEVTQIEPGDRDLSQFSMEEVRRVLYDILEDA